MLKWVWKKKEKTAADRDSERHDVSVRVKSRQLPGYRALSLDISHSGIQLETQELLEKGQQLVLEFEFDREELPDFTMPAEVMWARPDGERRARFLAGLAFQPASHDEKRDLARMSAVLETRSEADIKDLLAEANRLDPSRAAIFNRTGTEQAVACEPVSASEPKAAVSQQVSLQEPSAPTQPVSAQPHPGVLIPLNVSLSGYQWQREQDRVVLNYTVEGQNYALIFPNCQACFDHGCCHHGLVATLYATTNSEQIRFLKAQRGERPWKHYRFLGPQQEPVLDILSLSFVKAEV